MPLYFGGTKSKFRPGYNWSQGSVIIQKEKEILGFLNPGLNIFPIFEKMLHGLPLQRESNFILSPNTMNARTIAETRPPAAFLKMVETAATGCIPMASVTPRTTRALITSARTVETLFVQALV
jgi:hypothetical protein